jgi:polyisoprenoid-binding protein YceI
MTAIATEKLTIPEGTWRLDPVHSSVSFRVADLSQAMTFVNGRFTDFAGKIVGGDEPTAEGVIRGESDDRSGAA